MHPVGSAEGAPAAVGQAQLFHLVEKKRVCGHPAQPQGGQGEQRRASSSVKSQDFGRLHSCACCGDIPAWTHLSGGPGKSGTASHRSGMHGASCKAECMGWMQGQDAPHTHLSTAPPPCPRYLSKGRLFIFAFLPCSSSCLCVLPLQRQGGKGVSSTISPAPHLGEVRGRGRTGWQQQDQGSSCQASASCTQPGQM